MINAGTVGAYLDLDISRFTDNLSTAGQLLDQFRREYDDHAGGLGNWLSGALSAPILAAGNAVLSFAKRFSGASDSVRADAARSGSAIGALGASLHDAADAAAGLYSERIQSAAQGVAKAVRGVSGVLTQNGAAWAELAKEQQDAGQQISRNADDSAGSIRAAFGKIPTQTREVMRISWLGMLAHLNAGRPSLVAAAKKNGEGILGGINAVLNVPGGMHAVGGRAVDSLSSGMGSKRGSAVGSVRSLMQSMVTAAGSVSFTGIGGNVVGGILKGINNKAPTLMSRARNLATGIAETIRGALNVNSPSKVMIPMGQAVAEGMEVGLMQGAKGLYETASAISLETAETLGSISTRGVNYASVHSMNYGDRLDRLLDAVEKLADSQTTMEIDGRPFGRLVREALR